MTRASVQHSAAFRQRRFLNWAPLGVTYAFLYMGRYNLTVAKNALGDLMSVEQFGIIFGVGTLVYGLAFLINGPLTDRLGGRFAILMAAMGAGVANALMGYFTRDLILSGSQHTPTMLFSALYAVNMYFQSFGAVAIVKVNSNWFHVTERGSFSAIFGAIISSGIYLAFDVGYYIVTKSEGRGPGGVDATWWVFFVPSIALIGFFFIDLAFVRNFPSAAGHKDFDTGAARLSEDEDKPIPTFVLLRKILSNPIIITVAMIEFCSGVLRNGVMHWYPIYAKTSLVLDSGHFMRANWGLLLFVAGVSGATFAGLVSDKLFQSRRAPAAGGLYAGMIVAVGVMIFALGGTEPTVGWMKKAPEPATAAGLRAGDLILSVDGKEVIDRARLIAALDKDATHTLGILRRGEARTLELATDDKTRKALKLRNNMVAVKGFEIDGKKRTVVHWKGAFAIESGLQVGDVILEFDGQKPADWDDFLEQLQANGKDTPLKVERDGEEVVLTLMLPEYAPSHPEEKAKFVMAGPVQKLNPMLLGLLAFFISLCVIGAHGLLSGTATMDFGGKRGTATAVGVIDGFVYLGTAVQSFSLGYITSHNWALWPIFLLPFAFIGFFLARRIWYAKPR